MESTFIFVCIFVLFLAGIALWLLISSKIRFDCVTSNMSINDTKRYKVYTKYAIERVEQYLLHGNESDLRIAEGYMRNMNKENIKYIKLAAEKAQEIGDTERANVLNALLDLTR